MILNYTWEINITIMERYDYLEAIKEDVLNYINGNNIVVTSGNRDEVEQDLNDTLFTCDSVTGNASGSYRTSCKSTVLKTNDGQLKKYLQL